MAGGLSILWDHSLRGGPLSSHPGDTDGKLERCSKRENIVIAGLWLSHESWLTDCASAGFSVGPFVAATGRSSKVRATVRVCAAAGRQLARTNGVSMPTRRCLRMFISFAASCLGANGGMQGVGERLAEALDVGFVFGFDHDAGQLLGAGVTQHHAAFVAERGLSFS